jgi:peptidoglycan/LPS O-acetylase OafA/YrhL
MRLDVVYGLPGVFTDNPQPLAVNGSLWTLPIEVKAYIMLLVLGLGGLLRRPWVLALAIGVLAWVLASSSAPPHPISDWLEGSLQTGLVVVFTGGALLYALRDTIRLDWRLAAAAALAAWLMRHGDDTVRSVAWALTIPYLLVFVAYRTTPALRALVKPGDLSYGIYLWAYPVQQTIVHALGPDISPGWLLLLSAGISYAIALASWRLVEAPVLRLKRRLSVKPVPRPTVAVP